MFVGVQVDIEGEGWMVRVVDKCYNCIYERDNLLDVIINYLFNMKSKTGKMVITTYYILCVDISVIKP